jgi:hypothetical protein
VLTKRVQVKWPDRGMIEYAERLRLYDRGELVAMVTAAGFEVRGEHGDYDLGPFDESLSQRMILVCRKRAEAS